ncbi:PAS domain-containing protein [Archangium violaceum]|uniref:ATP-binding protein n=1 Tax=Archangium violaceum TaxID=83451 RepID=UPI00193C2185|nr:ATP-binding protein [Archangium violaceum]QRK12511.1 PAS domain-containing protein [Archangium violaceum]
MAMKMVDDLTMCGGPATPLPSAESACLILTSTTTPAAIGKVFRIESPEHVLGRGADAGFQINDHGVSRRHARITRTPEGGFHLADLGSTNGTYLNGVRIASAELHEGDRVQIGTVTVLRFSMRELVEQGEEQLRQALSAARVGIWDWNAVTGAVTWSEQVDRLLTLPVGSLSGRPTDLSEVVHPGDLPRVREALSMALAQRAHLDVEYRIEVAGARGRWLSCKGDVLCDETGTPVRITGTVMDITERKLAEQELRRQALIFESLCEGVVITDRSGRIIDWNASAEKMFGRGKAEALGQTLFGLLRPGEEDKRTGEVLVALERQGRWTGEMDFTRPDGTHCYCESVVAPLRDAEGRTIAHILVHRDTTERRLLQTRLQMADRLASVGTLGAGVAHEINNPLAYMLVNLHLVSEGLERLRSSPVAETVEPLHQVVRETVEGAERIASIVRDLKTFARGQQEDRLGPVEVSKAVELACKMADNVIKHRARLVTQFEPVPSVQGNESRLCQVFLNLLLNAAHAIPEGDAKDHEIRVVIRESGTGEVVVEVRDTGVGMPPEVQARIFDPFFTTKSVGEGTGLGLSICHGIIDSMGGRIAVESAPGKGSSFRVHLGVAGVPAETRPEPAPVPAPGRARILVVDDEPYVTRALQRSLSPEHEVATVTGARAALKLLDQGNRFDLILCDVMMPGMTGMDLYAELNRAAPDQAQRVVFMTGGAFTPRALSFLQEVPNPKLSKPLDLRQLRALVGRSAQSPASAASPPSPIALAGGTR